MKKILSFLFIIILLSNITFSKGFFKTLKDIRHTYKSRKLISQLLEEEPTVLNWLLERGLIHDNARMKKLIKKVIPWFKEKDALSILSEINESEDPIFYDELLKSLYEFSYNSNDKYKNKILDQITSIQQRMNEKDFRIFKRAIAHTYYILRNYIKTLEELKPLIVDTQAALVNYPNEIYFQKTLKDWYYMQGICYSYIQFSTNERDNKDQYIKARESFQNCIDSYPDIYTYMIPVSYTNIGRTYLYEKDYEKADEYFLKAMQSSLDLSEERHYDAEAHHAEILAINGEYTKALEIFDWIIENVDTVISPQKSGYTSYPDGVCCAYYNRAVIYKDLGDLQKAEYNLQKGFEAAYHTYRDPAPFLDPAVTEYRDYYMRKLKILSNEMPTVIYISPQKITMNIETKTTIEAYMRVESGAISNPEFINPNPEIYEIVSQSVDREKKIVKAELLAKSNGNGEILFKVSIDGEIIERKAEIEVYELKLFNNKNEEAIEISPELPLSEYINRGRPIESTENEYNVVIDFYYDGFAYLYIEAENHIASMEKVDMRRDYSNPLIYLDYESGYMFEILDNNVPTISKNETKTKKFKITRPSRDSLTVELKKCESDEDEEIYSNIVYDNFTNLPAPLSDNTIFRIRLNLDDEKIDKLEFYLEYKTDAESSEILFKKESEGILISEDLILRKTDEDYLNDFKENSPYIINYKKDPTITMRLSDDIEHKIFPSKGFYFGVGEFNRDMTFIDNSIDAIKTLGYNILRDYSITSKEFYQDAKKCNVMYLSGHGIQDKHYCFSFGGVSKKEENDFEIDPYDIPDGQYNYKMIYVEACNSLSNKKITSLLFENLMERLKPEIYIGWSNWIHISGHARNFAPNFFNACKTDQGENPKKVRDAFRWAKGQLVKYVGKYTSPYWLIMSNEANAKWVDTNLNIYPPEPSTPATSIDLIKRK